MLRDQVLSFRDKVWTFGVRSDMILRHGGEYGHVESVILCGEVCDVLCTLYAVECGGVFCLR